MCGARRGRLSQREKVTGRAFDRQIGSTKREDRYADCQITTGLAFDHPICYATGDRKWSSESRLTMRRVLTGFVNLAATEYPPYYGKDLEGHGFMTELIIEAFARVGYDVTVKFLPWKRALESAKSGKYDGLFTVWYPRLEDNLIAGGYDA